MVARRQWLLNKTEFTLCHKCCWHGGQGSAVTIDQNWTFGTDAKESPLTHPPFLAATGKLVRVVTYWAILEANMLKAAKALNWDKGLASRRTMTWNLQPELREWFRSKIFSFVRLAQTRIQLSATLISMFTEGPLQIWVSWSFFY